MKITNFRDFGWGATTPCPRSPPVIYAPAVRASLRVSIDRVSMKMARVGYFFTDFRQVGYSRQSFCSSFRQF